MRPVSILMGSKDSTALGSAFSGFKLTVSLELFHNTDDGSAPREIRSPIAAYIQASYSNAYPMIMH